MAEVVIIVGAPRSGTNMLRDALSALPGFTTWPCDEINLMWKHGNRGVPSDELVPAQATPEVRRYLRRQFQRRARADGAAVVVEKTCATSLRVAFAAAVFPEAKFLFIRRHGLDAAASTMQRWDAPFDWRYSAKKVPFVPKADLPFYGWSFISNRVRGVLGNRGPRASVTSGRTVQSWWGPRPHDFQALLREHPLDEIALLQWQRCVEASRRDLAALPAEQVCEVVYEDFVADPARGLAAIAAFLGHSDAAEAARTETVSRASVGKGRAQLSGEARERLERLGGGTLGELGYV